MADGIKIPVEAQLDGGSVQKQLEQLRDQINRLGGDIAKANQVKFTPIDKTTIDDLKRVTASFENLRRISGDLNKRLKATGQGGSGFLDVDWNKLYPDQSSRARQMRKAFEYVTGMGFQQPPSTRPQQGPAQPSGGGGAAPPPGGGGGGYTPGDAGRQVVHAGLRASGGFGSAVSSGLSAGASGGIGAGLMGFMGGFAALAIGKAIGAVTSKIGDAGNEFIGYDTLKRSLGDVNVGFNVLKESLRNSARELDMTFDETLKLGTQFTKLSGITKEQHKTLAAEVANAGGFGRSFGMDPSQSTAFFAQMRQFRVTGNETDSRRLALMIGEAVSKSNTFSKVDEVMESIANYTAQQTRMGMGAANVGGYTSLLTGLMGSKVPGLDPGGAAALLNRVNTSIAGGGAAGEAGQNFLFSALGSKLGLDPLQTIMLREQGAFGTGRGTFGSGSLYSRFAGQYGLATPGAAGSDATNFQLIMDKMRQVYAGKPELMLSAMSNLFGTNLSQSMALSTINPTQLGGLSKRLGRLGININDVNATGISRISQIESDGKLSEAEKDRRIKEAATQNQEDTEGSKTRRTINGVERAVQDMAGRLVPLTNEIRNGIMYLAGEGGKKSPREIQEAILRAESLDRTNEVRARVDPKLAALYEKQGDLQARTHADVGNLYQAYHDKPDVLAAKLKEREANLKELEEINKRIANLEQEKKVALQKEETELSNNLRKLRAGTLYKTEDDTGSVPSASRPVRHRMRPHEGGPIAAAGGSFAAEATAENLSPEERRLAQAIYGQETGGGANTATSINGAMGHMQMLPATFQRFADPGWDINNPEHNRRAAMRYIKYLNRLSGGNLRTTAGAYYGGEGAIGPGGSLKLRYNRMRPSDPSTHDYGDQVMDRYNRIQAGESATPLPADGRQSDAGVQRHQVSGQADVNVTVQLPNGQPVGRTSVQTRLNSPRPQGTG